MILDIVIRLCSSLPCLFQSITKLLNYNSPPVLIENTFFLCEFSTFFYLDTENEDKNIHSFVNNSDPEFENNVDSGDSWLGHDPLNPRSLYLQCHEC